MIREVHERDKQIFPSLQSVLHSSPLLPSSCIVLQPQTQGMFYSTASYTVSPSIPLSVTGLPPYHTVCVPLELGLDIILSKLHNVTVFISFFKCNYIFLKNNINVLFLI